MGARSAAVAPGDDERDHRAPLPEGASLWNVLGLVGTVLE